MKKLTIIILILSLQSCIHSNHAPNETPKERICMEILDQRERDRSNHEPENIKNDDSLFIKCGCDTLK